MSELQIFQLLGLVYFVIGAGMFFNAEFYKRTMIDYSKSGPAMFVSGILSLVIGCLLVTFHNTWDWNWSIIITIVGWIAFLKGVMILVSPGITNRVMKFMRLEEMNFKILGMILALLGASLIHLGYCVL